MSLKIFGVDPPKLELDAKIEHMKVDVLAPLTPEEKKLLETGTPEFKSTAIARFCLATDNTKVPVRFHWKGAVEKGVVRVWQWSEMQKRSEVRIGEFVAKKDKKTGENVPNEWECTIHLHPGRWAFQWEVDGNLYFSNGDAIPAENKDSSYKVLEVKVIKPIFV